MGICVNTEPLLDRCICGGDAIKLCLFFQFHCTGLSWNSTGSVLAVSYGKLDHQDWCAHKVCGHNTLQCANDIFSISVLSVHLEFG